MSNNIEKIKSDYILLYNINDMFSVNHDGTTTIFHPHLNGFTISTTISVWEDKYRNMNYVVAHNSMLTKEDISDIITKTDEIGPNYRVTNMFHYYRNPYQQ